jgi:hypothetical protein
MSLKLRGEWKLGMQIEADRLQDTEGSGLHTQLLQSLTIGHKIFSNLEGMAETIILRHQTTSLEQFFECGTADGNSKGCKSGWWPQLRAANAMQSRVIF